MANELTTHTTNRDGSMEPRSVADNDLQGAVYGDGARLGDGILDDILIADRVVGEVAEYRAAMTATLRRRLLTTLWMPLKKAVYAIGAVRMPAAHR